MLFATIGQGSVFMWMLLAGMMIGVLYDAFRLLRCILRAGCAMTLALDVLWGAGSGAVLAVMLVIANRGMLRPYVLLAVLMGFGLHQAAVSRHVTACAGRVARVVRKLSRFRLLRAVFK